MTDNKEERSEKKDGGEKTTLSEMNRETHYEGAVKKRKKELEREAEREGGLRDGN